MLPEARHRLAHRCRLGDVAEGEVPHGDTRDRHTGGDPDPRSQPRSPGHADERIALNCVDFGAEQEEPVSQAERGPAGSRRDIVVVGASAGGVEALVSIARALPGDFPAAVFVVLHLPEGGRSYLASILARAGALPAAQARDGAPVRPGTITVAQPDCHLILEEGTIRVVRGPKVNATRPAVDVLFHSAARSYDGRVVGVVLTGNRTDGTLGLRAIKRRGGIAIVQADPVHEGMPTSAIQNVEVDAVVPLEEIAERLTMMVDSGKEVAVGDGEKTEESPLEAGFDIGRLDEAPGDPTVFRCPECGGALWELEDAGLQAYVCHVGHSFSAESLLAEQQDDVERALWSAVRLLEERAALNERLAERVGDRGLAKSRGRFESSARLAYEEADVIRKILELPSREGEDDLEEGEAA